VRDNWPAWPRVNIAPFSVRSTKSSPAGPHTAQLSVIINPYIWPQNAEIRSPAITTQLWPVLKGLNTGAASYAAAENLRSISLEVRRSVCRLGHFTERFESLPPYGLRGLWLTPLHGVRHSPRCGVCLFQGNTLKVERRSALNKTRTWTNRRTTEMIGHRLHTRFFLTDFLANYTDQLVVKATALLHRKLNTSAYVQLSHI